jgi:cyclic beta-1,2-glucan synthetase
VAALPRHDLTFYNGLGGFTPDGREYVITTAPGQVTPAPWVNVLANPHFGTVISESGRPIPGARMPTSFASRPGPTIP